MNFSDKFSNISEFLNALHRSNKLFSIQMLIH